MIVNRCEVTHNMCGTDTWAEGHACECAPNYCPNVVSRMLTKTRIRARLALQGITTRLKLAGDTRMAQRVASVAASLRLGGPGADVEQTDVQVDEQPEETQDLQTLLKDESDTILQILRTQDSGSDLRKELRQLYAQARSLQTTLRSIGKGFVDSLGVEDTKEIDESTIGELRDAFNDTAKGLDDLLTTASILKSYEAKIRDTVGVEPIQHRMPQRSKRELQKSQIKTTK